MNREEEILNKAIDYSEIEGNFLEYYDCGDFFNDKEFIEQAYIEGAKWADKTMPKEKYIQFLNEILTHDSSDEFTYLKFPQKAFIDKHPKSDIVNKQEFIDKACKWLLSQEEMIGISFKDDFIERFKKAMEE